MARTISFYIDAALDAFNAGFTSKAAQKSALDDVSRAFDIVSGEVKKAVLARRPFIADTATHEEIIAWHEAFHASIDGAIYDAPFYLHLIREKHINLIDQAGFGIEARTIESLIDLRNQIKAAPINKPTKDTATIEAKARIEKSIVEIMQLRGEQYARALNLGELFNGLPVSANSHWVVNQHNTQFVRTFYYLAGELTPLNVIIAAAQELERRKEGADA